MDEQLKKAGEQAMEMTQAVGTAQQNLRKSFVTGVKQQMAVALQVKKDWQQTVNQMTHERSVSLTSIHLLTVKVCIVSYLPFACYAGRLRCFYLSVNASNSLRKAPSHTVGIHAKTFSLFIAS